MNQKTNISNILFKAIVIASAGFIIGVLYNTFSQDGIELVGAWGSKIVSDSVAAPYNYQPEDPEAVTLSQALKSFESEEALFVDCRLKEDFDSGHIKGAVSLPWEEFDQYYPEVSASLSEDKEIIAYCDGSECELSLLLARELTELGYKTVKVFFGGLLEWTKADLPVEKEF
jgi:rhodanese-related sulfurtransferase